MTSWPQSNKILAFPLTSQQSLNGSDNVTSTLETTFSNTTYVLFADFDNNNNDTLTQDLTTTLSPTPTGPQRSSSLRSEVPIWLILCYSVILLFAIVGNLLVIIILAQNRRMRTITNVFLLNLAISDILLGVLCMPVTLVGTLLRHFIFGEYFCKLIQFSQGKFQQRLTCFFVYESFRALSDKKN